MFEMETAKLKPEEIAPQNRRAACYLHYDLANIAGQLSYLSGLLKALSNPEMDIYFLREVPAALAFAETGVDGLFWALENLCDKIANAHDLSTTLVTPDWWQQVEEMKGGTN